MQVIPNARALRLTPADPPRDLGRMRDELIAEYFPEGVVPRIGWARRLARRSMGCYLRESAASEGAGTIRINPLLGCLEVPELYLRYVVYHELLHAHVAPLSRGGRTHHHHRLFRVREREFRDYAEARRWERDELPRLVALLEANP